VLYPEFDVNEGNKKVLLTGTSLTLTQSSYPLICKFIMETDCTVEKKTPLFIIDPLFQSSKGDPTIFFHPGRADIPQKTMRMLQLYEGAASKHMATLTMGAVAEGRVGFGHSTPAIPLMIMQMLQATPVQAPVKLHLARLELIADLEKYKEHLEKHKNDWFYSARFRNKKINIIDNAISEVKNGKLSTADTISQLEKSSIAKHSFWGSLAKSEGAKIIANYKTSHKM
jgi:hypothetical protein